MHSYFQGGNYSLFYYIQLCYYFIYLIFYSRASRQSAMVAAKISSYPKAAIINDMSVASLFGKEYINTIAIVGGVIGFWGGVFVLGIIYHILVFIRRCRKHTTTEASGGAVVRAMMGTYSQEGGFDGRPPTRSDQVPRPRKATKAHHRASFYNRGPKRRDQDSGGMNLGRLGEFTNETTLSIISLFKSKFSFKIIKYN
jgi:hypothetical protein